jgi:HEPN domain-containing protein
VKKAEGDYGAVCILRRSRKPGRYDAICFHCQQCAEKYLKARMNEAGIAFSKTHDLAVLLLAALAVEPLWAPMEIPLRNLSNYAVTTRYPGASTNAPMAADAFRVCSRMRGLARTALGIA